MTPILKLITEYCSIYVDDIRLQDLASVDSPLYARKMWGYLKPAISLFTLPAEMPEYLVGTKKCPKLIEPLFDNTLYTTSENYTAPFEINLGSDFEGYELCSCRVKSTDNLGNTVLTPILVEYDESTATVTVNASETAPIAEGTIFDFDFYTDGYFLEFLSPEIMNILGMCFQVVWQDRFNSDWLSNVTKIEDRSFYEQNRANKMRADTERLRELRQKLAGEMRRFEQNSFYKQTVKGKNRLSL